MKIIQYLALFIFVTCGSHSAFAQLKFNGKVVEIVDGKTVVIELETKNRLTAELQYIEVPEPQQQLHQIVKDHLQALLLGKFVEFRANALAPTKTVGQIFSDGVDISQQMIKKGDSSDEIKMAQFWDCNPYVTVNQGHMMFAKKKITPGGHWMGIVKIACKKANADFEKTVYAFTKTSIGLFDAFISCWDEKYRSNVVRPETVINQNIDENWRPLLQTPPFPEYPSGHSVASACSATVLTSVFGDDFSYLDDTELPYGLPSRSFKSFNDAANEAAMSRFYGGIHYKAAIVNGIDQGKNVGNYIIAKLKMIK